tara:strand:- start:303 stop:626 length:324 start_codon:yes stop_codon:yes gene_type:complete
MVQIQLFQLSHLLEEVEVVQVHLQEHQLLQVQMEVQVVEAEVVLLHLVIQGVQEMYLQLIHLKVKMEVEADQDQVLPMTKHQVVAVALAVQVQIVRMVLLVVQVAHT